MLTESFPFSGATGGVDLGEFSPPATAPFARRLSCEGEVELGISESSEENALGVYGGVFFETSGRAPFVSSMDLKQEIKEGRATSRKHLVLQNHNVVDGLHELI